MNLILSHRRHLRPVLLSIGIALLVLAAAHSNPDPVEHPDQAIAEARTAVQTQVVSKLLPDHYQIRSRAAAPRGLNHYHVEIKPPRHLYLDGADRTLLYFYVLKQDRGPRGRLDLQPSLAASGWYVLESQEIVLFDENIAKHVPLDDHPLASRG